MTTPIADKTVRLHVIPNAHLDPVWLWDYREGLNEGIQTCRTMLDLMDEVPGLTFIRGESAIYEHIERHAPEVFERIKKMVKAGRWDVVGGTYIQPDTNLPATETFCRHYEVGKRYFKEKFGVDVKVAWAADSFGHAAGLPDVMANAGIESFAFTRPFASELPLPMPVFYWQGNSGAKILSYRPTVGWYGSERDETVLRMNGVLEEATKFGFKTLPLFLGLGNHGGGTTRRMLRELEQWGKEHADVEIVFSGLHRFFDELNAEIARRPELKVPTFQGELGYTLRGCYSSAARFKFAYRKAEAQLIAAEKVSNLAGLKFGFEPADLSHAWKTLMFNSFHDVLPGTSIERAMDEQTAQLGGVLHAARDAELHAINEIAHRLEITETLPKDDAPLPVPFLVINPNSEPFDGPLEFETCMDYRPILPFSADPAQLKAVLRDEQGSIVPSQAIRTEHTAMRDIQWRRRVIANVQLPAFGYRVLSLGIDSAGDYPRAVDPNRARQIELGEWKVDAENGSEVVKISRGGKELFGGGIRLVTVEDPYGSWGPGDKNEESKFMRRVRHRWTIERSTVVESGPILKRLWVQMKGGNSRCDFLISLTAGRNAVDVSARVMWDERSARLKMAFAGCGGSGEFDVPGMLLKREGDCGEVAGGRWATAEGRSGSIGFASNALYNFDLTDGDFRVTIARSSRYADSATMGPEEEPYTPATDVGELKFNCALTDELNATRNLGIHTQNPPIVQMVPRGSGKESRSGVLSTVGAKGAEVISVQKVDGRLKARLQGQAGLSEIVLG